MNKELEAFNVLTNSHNLCLTEAERDEYTFIVEEALRDAEKNRKALETIKAKKWLVEDILNAFIEDKEKHDLLKEVLL